MDRLQEILELQDKLNSRLTKGAVEAAELNLTDRTKIVEFFIKACHSEIEEVRNCLPWKHWKQYKLTDENVRNRLQKAREEFIDLLHFVLSIGLTLGMNSDMIYNMYKEKNRINHERQNDGYKE